MSFGNVSARGGYHISANAERVRASPTIATGRVGVFRLRMDLRGLSKRCCITFDPVPTSPLNGSSDPFCGGNQTRLEKCSISSDQAYRRFLLFLFFFDEAAIALQQYDIVPGSQYNLRTYHTFFPCQ